MPNAAGPFRARFSARSSGPCCIAASTPTASSRHASRREIAHRQWHGYRVYREFSTGVRFRIAGQEVITAPGDLMIADADALFEASPAGRYADESWLVPKSLLEPHLPAPLECRVPVGPQRRQGTRRRLPGRSHAQLGQHIGSRHGADHRNPVAVARHRLRRDGRGTTRRRARRQAGEGKAVHRAASGGSRPDPGQRGGALGISVRSLHVLFEPTGTSFARYVLSSRLNECRAALLGEPGPSGDRHRLCLGFQQPVGLLPRLPGRVRHVSGRPAQDRMGPARVTASSRPAARFTRLRCQSPFVAGQPRRYNG